MVNHIVNTELYIQNCKLFGGHFAISGINRYTLI